MDAVEVARKVAAELHALSAQSTDPTKVYEFALDAAKRCDLDVEEVPIGSSLLDGGHAKLLHAKKLIIHEAAPTEFEKAFLVAHEVGHEKCGDGEGDDVAVNIDATRSSEQARCAAEQIVDYGKRQRREVQMDLFAREFLLPRNLVRRLHLLEGLSASQISAKYHAPFAVVAQQLLDALLLPQVNEVNDQVQEPPAQEENPDQRNAAEHLGKAFLLEAGPGTGKTRTLVERVEFLLSRKVDPRQILVLTFSNKAALEMNDRIAARNKNAAVAMWIGTFHAFGLDIVRRFHSELGYKKVPRLLNITETVEILENEFARLKLKHFKDLHDPTDQIESILSAISRAKDEVVDADRYAALAEEMRKNSKTEDSLQDAERACDVATAYKAYETLKRSKECLDFGDLVYLPVKLLETDSAIRESLRHRYEHILVDEYQDVNRSSVRLLTALSDGGRNLWAVGDPRQSIYRFRGASSFNVSRFGKEDFPGGIRSELKLNYRSTPEIVAAFSTFASSMTVGAPKAPFAASRKSAGSTIELRKCDSPESIVPIMADAIEELRSNGVPYRGQAVLCFGNDTLATVGASLEGLGIPVIFLGSLFERAEIRHLLSLLSLLNDSRAPGIIHLGSDKKFALSLSDVASIIDYLRANDRAPMSWVSEETLTSSLSETGRAAVSELGKVLRGFSSASQPWEVLATYLLDRSRIAVEIAESRDVRVRARGIAIWQFMSFVRVQPASVGEPVPRLLIRIRRLLRLGDDTDLREPPSCAQALDAVRLTTVHRSKGLEFPAVHIVGAHANVFPGRFQKPGCMAPDGMLVGAKHSSLEALETGHDEERECVFYVGVSRARDHLRLYATSKKRDGSSNKLSPYIDRLGTGVRATTVTPRRKLPTAVKDALVDLKFDGTPKFSAYQLTQFSRCPRSFFYTFIMNAGGKKSSTPFLLMHDAVRKVVESMLTGYEGNLGELLDKEFALSGLAEHGYVAEYHAFALEMLEFLHDIRAGKKSIKTDSLLVRVGSETITVTPHELVEDESGRQILRSIRTGSKRSKSHQDFEAAALLLAAVQQFKNADAEIVFLNDKDRQPIVLSETILRNRSQDMEQFYSSVKEGKFPTEAGEGCARCASLFYCGSLSTGSIVKKIS